MNNELKCKLMSEEIRLIYYNDYLYEKGIITKSEHTKMNLAIISKCGKKKKELI